MIRRTRCCLLLLGGACLAASAAGQGVVVERVAVGSTAERSGLAPGDHLTAWERLSGSATGPPGAVAIGPVSDWLWLEREVLPAARVRLHGHRGGHDLAVDLTTGIAGLTVRPWLEPGPEALYEQGRELWLEENVDGAVAAWQPLAAAAEQSGRWELAAWVEVRLAQELERRRLQSRAEERFAAGRSAADLAGDPVLQLAVAVAESQARRREVALEATAAELPLSEAGSPASLFEALLLRMRARAIGSGGQIDAADRLVRTSLGIEQRRAEDSAGHAACLSLLGGSAIFRGRLSEGERLLERARRSFERYSPGSVDLARSLDILGQCARERGHLDRAESLFREALAIQEKVAPDSADSALSLHNLGIIATDRGRLEEAEENLQRALAIRERLSAGSLDVAWTLNSLGLVSWSRGLWDEAEQRHRQALAIRERLAPDSMDVAASLNNLGVVLRDRGSLQQAWDCFQRSMEIRERLAPRSIRVALCLHNLGYVAQLQGRTAAAEEHYRRAMELWDELAPESLDSAWTMVNLGDLRRNAGDPAAATALWERALAIAQTAAPGSQLCGRVLQNLGLLHRARGDLEAGWRESAAALEIFTRVAPRSFLEAESLDEMGVLCRATGRLPEARSYFLRALDAIELQVDHLGGTEEERVAFRARYKSFYQNLIGVELELGQAEAAFQLVEQYRAKAFLRLLAERDLLAGEMPQELATVRRQLSRDYDDVLREIAALPAGGDPAVYQAELRKLEELQQRREELIAALRRVSPQLAGLRYPEPLTFAEASGSLDPGTVALSYFIGEAGSSWLFILERGRPLEVIPLATSERELREAVSEYLDELLRAGRAARHRPEGARLVALGERLHELLLQPAVAASRRGKRLLVIPDGALHGLPFAALVAADPAGRGWRYLVEERPIHLAMSLTVYQQLRARQRSPERSRSATVAAFGDPAYGPSPGSAGATAAAAGGAAISPRFEPLPATRAEALALARLYDGNARVFLGEDASEENVKRLDRSTRILHLACHGLLDENLPLNSALALSTPTAGSSGQDNGLLQVWEIFEQLRLDAELVTLSACQSGLGRELGGEGLIGLSRAFQYAGARSVLASLWSVADASTAELMERFYTELRKGRPKDEALRQAQLELIRRRSSGTAETVPGDEPEVDTSAPFHWAAFELLGDWR